MPGINSKNYHLVLKRFDNLYQVAQATLEELTEVFGSSVHAKQLHTFLHKEQTTPLDQPGGSGSSSTSAGRRLAKRGKFTTTSTKGATSGMMSAKGRGRGKGTISLGRGRGNVKGKT